MVIVRGGYMAIDYRHAVQTHAEKSAPMPTYRSGDGVMHHGKQIKVLDTSWHKKSSRISPKRFGDR
jgi:hypothetical protein